MINNLYLKLLSFALSIIDHKNKIQVIDYFKKKNLDNITLIDIGAHRGETIKYFNKYIKIKNIYAFEPNKKNFLRLKENSELNNLNINLYNFGLSNLSSESEIWFTNKDKMGGSAIFDKNDPELSKYDPKNIIKEKVLIKKLDEILEINNSKILIKIDVERHEKKVLEGMNKMIKQNNIIMQIEIGDENKEDVFNYLDKLSLKWINTIKHDHYFIKDF